MMFLIKQQRQKQQMMTQMNPSPYARGYGPPHPMPHPMNRSMGMMPTGYPMRPTMRYPGMGDFGRGMPIGHPGMGAGGYHPSMGPSMGPRMGPMTIRGPGFPPNDPRLRPGMNQNFSFSEQLRQQAAMYTTHRPDMSFGPQGPGGPQRFPAQPTSNMMSSDNTTNGPSGNFGHQPPPQQNGEFMAQYPSSYSPSAQINQQSAQNGPGKYAI